MNQIKYRKDQMIKVIQQKRKKEDYMEESLDAKNQIQIIEDNTKKELVQARSQVFTKIQDMRKAADRRKLVFLWCKESRRQIEDIRSHIAKTVMSSERKGDPKHCSPQKSEEQRHSYCDDQIGEDTP